jgi:Arc/MetJ family transcription regulator
MPFTTEDPTPGDPGPTPVDIGLVRLLINDTDTDSPVFSNDEVLSFLALEGDVVKLAAAQALDTIADDEALTSKVIRTQDLTTDGAKVADALRKRAAALRAQVASQADAADEGFFDVIDFGGPGRAPELTEDPYCWPAGWIG